jgi:endonuclease YncB( thermonuclease family)
MESAWKNLARVAARSAATLLGKRRARSRGPGGRLLRWLLIALIALVPAAHLLEIRGIFGPFLQPSAGKVAGWVESVADGDTLTIRLQTEEKVRIRLSGIDAPEKGQAHWRQSWQSLVDLCLRRPAEVTIAEFDKYGRAVGKVDCQGKDANAEQVRRGLAWVYQAYSHDAVLLALETQARDARLGLWENARPIPPWEYRRKRG